MYALIDCNNFFASCERIFDPSIRNRPVVVLSNNDGCIIARSNEAKALGIKMGEPFYKARDVIRKNNVAWYSSNFELYGDISSRVMKTVANYCAEMEIYSIDEAFLRLENIPISNLYSYGKELKDLVYKNVGIPISVGISKTKTLAKVASKKAKKNEGVCVLVNDTDIDKGLEDFDIDDVWGVGRQYSEFLRKYGIDTPYKLKNMSENWIRKNMKVFGLRLVSELKGVPCYDLENSHVPKKGIISSRTFGRYIQKKEELYEAISVNIERACRKLRQQKSVARGIYVYFKTNPHSNNPWYKGAGIKFLENPSCYDPDFVKLAHKIVDENFKPGFKYNKSGISLHNIESNHQFQVSLFNDVNQKKFKRLMESLDYINHVAGKESVFFASNGVNRCWANRKNKISKRAVTRWNEILKISI